MPKYADLCTAMDKSGHFMSNAIGMCQREVRAVRRGEKSQVQRFLADSDTYQAFLRQERIGDRYDESRAEPAYLVWTHDIKSNQLCRPFPVSVDWESGVVRQENGKVFGLLSDVRDCLQTRDDTGELIPLTGRTGKTMDEAEPSETREDYDTPGTIKPGANGGTQRIGQDWFRTKLIATWDGRCSVTGCAIPALLKASHIVAWKIADGKERLDENNGLLLVATLDAAFDRGIISFADDGRILLSPEADAADLAKAHIHDQLRLRFVPPQTLPYLARHRAHYGFQS